MIDGKNSFKDDVVPHVTPLRLMRKFLPLVSKQEIDSLKNLLSQASMDTFIIHFGECAERFNLSEHYVTEFVSAMQSFALKAKKLGKSNVICLGRFAGQFVKPRTSDFETINGIKIPSYKGDMINDIPNFASSRKMKPYGIEFAYYNALKYAYTMRVFSDFSLTAHDSELLFFSHELLSLEYELLMSRLYDGKIYATSAHLLWLGDRTTKEWSTSQIISYAAILTNPIAIKLGTSVNVEDIINLLELLNPLNEKGKILLIVRMGALIKEILPPILYTLLKKGINFLLLTDPVHANTIRRPSGEKIRFLDDVENEIIQCINIAKKEGVKISGLHLECTTERVSECIYRRDNREYPQQIGVVTPCDPRLNKDQALYMLELFLNECGCR